MSLLVKGMEMPKSCYDCVLIHSFFRDLNCANLEGMSGFGSVLPHTNDRHPDCPLSIVTPHGRLIDADKLIKDNGLDKATKYGNETKEQIQFSYDTMMMYEIFDLIDDAEVIIEADMNGGAEE